MKHVIAQWVLTGTAIAVSYMSGSPTVLVFVAGACLGSAVVMTLVECYLTD